MSTAEQPPARHRRRQLQRAGSVRRLRAERGAGRRGTAAAELAVCLPLITLFVFGSIEATDAIFLKQILKTAAYEGARAATEPNSTDAGARAAAQAVLTARGVSGGTISITPVVTANTAAATQVTVTISATAGSNSAVGHSFSGFIGTTISASTTMAHE